jgi:hypothetical protein
MMLLVASGAIVSCYKPTIGNMLKCNLNAGTHACPDGFKCETASGFCRRNPSTDAAIDHPDADAGRDGPTDTQVGPTCLDAGRGGCTPSSDAGICDPYCQTGCDGCRKKCSVNTLQTVTCNDVPLGPTAGLMQFCTPLSTDLPGQTDNCEPGHVCITDGCFDRCYRFCRQDSDCTNAGCNREVIAGGQKVCDVPFVDCTPLPGNANTGCGGGTMACYLSSSHPNRTVCDCPFNAVGANGPCTRSRDCVPGLVCVDRGPMQPGVCLQVCRLGTDDCGTGNPMSCRNYTGRPLGTTMHATYGYCF